MSRFWNTVQVLEHGIGGAAVPAIAQLLLRRHDVDVFAQAGLQEPPAAFDVTNQTLGLVLGQHPDAAQAGVNAVGENEVDDAQGPAKRHGRFGAVIRQATQPGASSASEDQRVGMERQ